MGVYSDDRDYAPARAPRARGKRAAAPAAGADAAPASAPRPAKRAAAAADEATFPFDQLPSEAQEAVCIALTSLSKVDTCENVARDVLALAGTSRALRSLAAEILWLRLAARLEPPSGGAPWAPELGAAKALRHEALHFRAYEVWDIDAPLSPAYVRSLFARRPPTAALPLRVFAEVRRARSVGMSETKGKAFFGLTDADVRAMTAPWMAPRNVQLRPPLGTMKLRPLAALAAAARARYATSDALDAELAARAEAKQARADAEREREEAAPGGRAGARAARRAAKAEAAAQVAAWVSANTNYDALAAGVAAISAAYVRRRVEAQLRVQAVASWVFRHHRGDVAAAAAAVVSAPSGRAIAAMIRGVMRAHGQESSDDEGHYSY